MFDSNPKLRLSAVFGVTALTSAISMASYADTAATEAALPQFDAIHVSAQLFNDPIQAASVNVVPSAILRQGATTLGGALEGQVGIHSDAFGSGSSRPVIRGQSAPRVKVLSDSSEILDASQISPDHAVTVEPLLARKIEVIRGPATLRYGGGAIGGIVNVLDNKVPTRLPENGVSGELLLRGDSAATERAVAGGVTMALGPNFALRVEGDARHADDYSAGRDGYLDADGEKSAQVRGTWSHGNNIGLGLSWIGTNGFLGAAYSERHDEYALPGHSHEYESCHIHGFALHCGTHAMTDTAGDGHDHDHNDEAPPSVQLSSKRFEVRGEYQTPMTAIEKLQGRVAYTDYYHDEIDAGVVGTTFKNKGLDGRIEAVFAPMNGWNGAIGLQFNANQFAASGDEAFVPESHSRMAAVFINRQRQWQNLTLELGARAEHQQHDVDNLSKRKLTDYSKTTASAAVKGTWQVLPDSYLSTALSYAQRHPTPQELYAKGVHLATNTYELGNNMLKPEQSINLDVGVQHKIAALTLQGNMFFNRINDYIYGKTLDRFENFRLLGYDQADANFYGIEGQIGYQVNPHYQVKMFGDYVRASLQDPVDGNNTLPRIPAARLGAGIAVGVTDKIKIGGEWIHGFAQDRIAAFEQKTTAYNMVNVDLSIEQKLNNRPSYQWYLQAKNLLNDNIYNHASHLSNVPQAGRNFMSGIRFKF